MLRFALPAIRSNARPRISAGRRSIVVSRPLVRLPRMPCSPPTGCGRCCHGCSGTIVGNRRPRWWPPGKSVSCKPKPSVIRSPRFAERYPALLAEMLALFHEVRAVDRDVSAVNVAAPPGSDHLTSVELTTRGMPAFSRDQPSVLETELLEWGSSRLAWPPRRLRPPPWWWRTVVLLLLVAALVVVLLVVAYLRQLLP